jgi:hypothetical protein
LKQNFIAMRKATPVLGPRGGLWPILLMCNQEGLCRSSGEINRLMMMIMRNCVHVTGGKPITQSQSIKV